MTASTTAAATSREMTYLEAISDALRLEMRNDERVFCIGQDIGAFGGAFKVTDGFAAEFGSEHGFSSEEIDSIVEGAIEEVEKCATTALASPLPDPGSALEGVFADTWRPLGDGAAPWSRWSEPANGIGNSNGHTNGNGRAAA